MSIRVTTASTYLDRTTNLPGVAFTAMGWFYVSGTAPGTLPAFFHSGGTSSDYLFSGYTTSTSLCHIEDGLGSADGATVLQSGVWYHVAVVRSGVNGSYTCRLYLNGVLECSFAGTRTVTLADLRVAAAPFGANNQFNGRVSRVKIYSRALTAGEVEAEMYVSGPASRAGLNGYYPLTSASDTRDYSGNLYSWTTTGTPTTEPDPPVYWSSPTSPAWLLRPAASGSPYTLPATAGSYLLTGTAAGTYKGSRAIVVAGSYALTGVAAGLNKGSKVVVSAGSFAETGVAANLLKGSKVVAAAGSYAESGQATGLLVGHRATVAAGAYSLSGVAAGTYKGRTLTAAAGSYTLSGVAAGLRATRTVTAAAGSFTLSGVAAGLLYGRRLAVAAGAYALNGNSAGLVYFQAGHYTLSASVGVFAASGAAANLLKASRVAATAGGYAESGISAGLYRGLRAAASAGAFAESGISAGLYLGRRTIVQAGSFGESGQSAGLLFSRRVAAGPGAFTLAGVAAGLTFGGGGPRTLTATAGAFGLSGVGVTLAWSGGSTPERDRDIRSAVRDLLSATDAFDAVYLTGTPDTHGQGWEDTRSASIDPVKEEYLIDGDFGGMCMVHGSAKLTFIAREYDDVLADDACERMFNVACNAINGQCLAGLTFPGFTRLTRAAWEKRHSPERRKSATLEYRYLVDTWDDFDTTD